MISRSHYPIVETNRLPRNNITGLIYFSFFTSFQASFCAFGCQQYSPKVRKRQSSLSVLFSKYLQFLCCKMLFLTEHVDITPVLHMFIGTMVFKWIYFSLLSIFTIIPFLPIALRKESGQKNQLCGSPQEITGWMAARDGIIIADNGKCPEGYIPLGIACGPGCVAVCHPGINK